MPRSIGETNNHTNTTIIKCFANHFWILKLNVFYWFSKIVVLLL